MKRRRRREKRTPTHIGGVKKKKTAHPLNTPTHSPQSELQREKQAKKKILHSKRIS